jgi:hypothetical protein
MTSKIRLFPMRPPSRWMAQCCCVFALVCGPALAAVDIGGVTLDDSTQVSGTTLKLNGAGIRTKVFFKVYVAALYLSEKKAALNDILTLSGPRRIKLVMLRDLSAEQLSEALMNGLQHNTDKNELAKKGDTLLLDWVPNEGTVAQLNGKRLGAGISDIKFNNAILKIWLGDKPADSNLRLQLLGEKR